MREQAVLMGEDKNTAEICGEGKQVSSMNEGYNDSFHLILDRLSFFGRTLGEYLKIFDLDLIEWRGKKILDCPAGASSFVAEAAKMGISATGCDPLYGKDIKDLLDRAKSDTQRSLDEIHHSEDLYNWLFYPSLTALKEYRSAAMERFARDYPIGCTQGRYVQGALPELPFEDQSFDLVLSSHFLFVYGDQFGYDFHLASILELHRVCSREVRIYPIQSIDSRPYQAMDRLLADLEHRNILASIVSVPFEFQRNANQQLRLFR
jgi:hypothetical protein